MEIILTSKEKVVQGNSWACAQNRIVAVKDKLKKHRKKHRLSVSLRCPKPLVLIPKTKGPIQYASRDVLETSQNRICFEHSRLPMLSPPISPRQFGGASQSSVWTKQKSRKLRFGTFEPLSYYRAYTFLAKWHSHSKCPAVSGC